MEGPKLRRLTAAMQKGIGIASANNHRRIGSVCPWIGQLPTGPGNGGEAGTQGGKGDGEAMCQTKPHKAVVLVGGGRISGWTS